MVESLPLDLLPAEIVRRRAMLVMISATVVAAAFGGVIGLFGGPTAGLITAAVIGLPLILLAVAEGRRRTILRDGIVSVRAFGTRSVDLRQATTQDVLVTDIRGNRTIGLLVSGPPKGKTINLALAMYSGQGGRELGILPLRRIADALAGGGNARSLVLSELLVAQLRAEAQGKGAADRPLFQLASSIGPGRLTRKLPEQAVAGFVAGLN
ncbi:hypothetical protein D5S17_13390 [Pseudonocardiaceae bacterium YIM PH 21723]|nr:hypothetical protein D5S17_13390 [Pseudonocardiaceae bacterium YIM PH 21723]